MSQLTDIAALIAEDASLDGWNPVVHFSPDFDLKDIAEKKCFVVPLNVERKIVSRYATELVYHYELGFFYRNKNLSMTTMIESIETISAEFLKKSISGTVCISTSYEPMYDVSKIKTTNQFSSVIYLDFKEIVND